MRHSIATTILCASAALALALPTAAAPTNIIASSLRSRDETSNIVELPLAFITGAGSLANEWVAKTNYVTGTDEYKCYSGGWTAFPPQTAWIDFDVMWNASIPAMAAACTNHGLAPDNTYEQIGQIWNAVQQVSLASLVDHRFVLATILQESTGCLATGATDNGVRNPGIMQSHAGGSFVGHAAARDEQQASITRMVVDGVQGTAAGDGLVQGVNRYGNIYEASRYYNSGVVDSSDLNAGLGATAAYVNDIANRMTGWMYANQGTSGACSICGIC